MGHGVREEMGHEPVMGHGVRAEMGHGAVSGQAISGWGEV